MKKISLFLLISFIAISGYTQQSDKKSKEILDKVTTKTESYKSMKIDFTYTMENKSADIDESKDGTITLKGDKFKLKIANQIVISDGISIWTYLPDAKEVQLNSVEEDDESINLNNILNSYSEDYKSKYIKTTTENGIQIDIIDLVPNEGKSYFKVRLHINKAKSQIIKSIIYDKNGSVYTYKINEFIVNPEVNDKEFTFNAKDYPDAEIIDMR